MKTKKVDKTHLKNLKIDIHTKNDIFFQDLALLFDKEEFLKMLLPLRKTYQVSKLTPLDDFEDFLNMEERGWFIENTKGKIDLSKYSRIKEVKTEFPEFYDFIHSSKNILPEVLDAECSLICYEFKRPPYFIDVIKQAIFCGAVDDTYFKPTEAKSVDFPAMGAWPSLNQIAIFVSPISTYEDVDAELRKAKEMMKSDEWFSYYQIHSDTTPNIRKYREWYWQYLDKDTTLENIATNWASTHENDRDVIYIDISKGIKSYKRLLAS